MRNNIKILVFTVNSWNKFVGSNTMTALLDGIPPENVANVYMRAETPSFIGCSNYFNIVESDVIKSIYRRKTIVGKRVQVGEDNQEELIAERKRYSKFSHFKPWILIYLREILWKLGKWKSPSFKSFLDEFKPDVILFSFEGYLHYNRVVRFAINYTHAKAIGYFWDDNFTYKQRSGSLGFLIHRFFQKRSIRKTVKLTDAFFAISEKTKKEADKIFNIDSVLLTKPLNREPCYAEKEIIEPIKILYTGNLSIGRDKSLVKVVDAVNEINKAGVKFTMDVYTSTVLSKKVTKKLKSDYCFIHNAIPQEEVLELQKNADILLFLEALRGKYSKMARLSFSTKITDYLSAGKCIFAVGCKDTAPIDYFDKNDCALISSDNNAIKDNLLAMLNNNQIISEYARKTVECALTNHKKEDILMLFHRTLESVLQK